MNPDVRAAGNEANRQAGLERSREVLRLHGTGLRGAELAEALGVSAGSVRSILTRARRRLGLPTPGSLECDRCRQPCNHTVSNDSTRWLRLCDPCFDADATATRVGKS